ncbi:MULTISPECIES: hypothetical protein [Chryseobacterium group]|uniref:Lipoprotein n=4 Tax=Chryseobacterium TaxID=59732 RepID=A0AAJ1R3G6_9FLAO|nr:MULTISPECIES: hypothetical protein [Chryseobacterium group]EFK33178.1 hypothetical protein HMPREF0204_12246 [Chryseobacterium gleum ATCC 35910]MDN4013271.1 hypothetical protein [Chryseobacterium gambrini]MDN4028875.1 hypothetical protein [Chryseobacterium gambrini]MDO3425169.1 hypothetical protein [Chryseobacterium sp. APV1]QQY33989.1 hypothetical protein I6I60_09590 [Chryseobacterium gleum]
MRVFALLFFCLFLVSCNKGKKIQSKRGGIDIVTNIYYSASKGLEEHQQIILSKMNYQDKDLIELVPNIQIPEIIDSVYYIRDSLYFSIGNTLQSKSLIFKDQKFENGRNVKNKRYGAMWIDLPISNYQQRKNLNDTVLYGKKHFKRFQIISRETYSIFYLNKTDTILPYSLNPLADKDYGGRLERIDSYDKKRDLFTTIVLLPRKRWDKEAADIFEYNHQTNIDSK